MLPRQKPRASTGMQGLKQMNEMVERKRVERYLLNQRMYTLCMSSLVMPQRLETEKVSLGR